MDDILQIQAIALDDFTFNLDDKDDNDLGNLATGLLDNAFVKRLTLIGNTNCTVTIIGWKALFGMLQVNKTIQSLDISKSNFDVECSHLFADMVLSNCNTLEELRFYFNEKNDCHGVSAMVVALCANPNGCALRSLTFEAEITVETNNIEFIKQLAGKFVTLLQQKDTVLKKLDLSCNMLGDDFMTVFADGLKKGTHLEKLYLNDNYIRRQGGINFGSALYFNTTLVELIMETNDMEDDGVNAITAALRYHPTLKVLDLNNNNMTEEGSAKASQILQYNEVLQVFEPESFAEWDPAPILSILDYNDTLYDSRVIVELDAFLLLNEQCERTAPKKGLRRRQQFYTWLEDDWIWMDRYNRTTNGEHVSTIIDET